MVGGTLTPLSEEKNEANLALFSSGRLIFARPFETYKRTTKTKPFYFRSTVT